MNDRRRFLPLGLLLLVTTLFYYSAHLFLPSSTIAGIKAQHRRFIFNNFKVAVADCATLFRGVDSNTTTSLKLAYYKAIGSHYNIWPAKLIEDAKNASSFCDNYKTERRYVTDPLTVEEANFGIAYGIVIFRDVEMLERLLRAIYRPQNYYCIHVDKSSDPLIHSVARAIANCFDNVFLPRNPIDIVYAEFSALEAELVCMKELLKYPKWKYFINLTGQEFPLRTNLELVRILSIFNGSNSVEGTLKQRYGYRYKNAPSLNVHPTVTKGAVHIAASRAFVNFAIHNETARQILEWVKHTQAPDETFFSSLHYSPHLGVPGAFNGTPESYENNNLFVARFKNWMSSGWGHVSLPCAGKHVRGLCIFGVGDLKMLAGRPELFANKFNADFEPLAYDCMEELLQNRTREGLRGTVGLNETFYKELAFVKNHI